MKPNECSQGFYKVERLPRGEYVKRTRPIFVDGVPKLEPQAKVYTRGEYDRRQKRYELVHCDNVNCSTYVAKGTMLYAGFTY